MYNDLWNKAYNQPMQDVYLKWAGCDEVTGFSFHLRQAVERHNKISGTGKKRTDDTSLL